MGWIIYNSRGEPLVTQEQHDHTAADASGPMTNDEHDGYSEYDEIAGPGAGAANKLRVYAKDVGGVTVLATVDAAGVENLLPAYPPSVQVYRGGDLTFTTNVVTDFTYVSESWDTDDMHDHLGANPERLTASIPGIWLVYAQMSWAAHAGHTQRLIQIITQGGTTIAANAVFASTDARGVSQSCMAQKNFAAGEWVKVQVRQRSGGDLASTGGVGQTFFGMVWLRPLP